MMKHMAVLFAIFIMAQSQRPPYAGNSKPYPAVLPQYLEEQAAAVAAAAPAVAPLSATVGVGSIANRIDASGSPYSASATSAATTTSTIPPDLPVDALGDVNLVNKIKTWPRDKQPFWFINWQQIQEHRGDTSHRTQPVQTETRSFFAG